MKASRWISMFALLILCSNVVVSAVNDDGSDDTPLTLRPSDGPFDTRMVPHYATWRVGRVLPDGAIEPQAVWTDRFEELDSDGERWLRFQTDATYSNGRRRRDIKFWHPTTLATRSIELHDYNGRGGWAHIGYASPAGGRMLRQGGLREKNDEVARYGSHRHGRVRAGRTPSTSDKDGRLDGVWRLVMAEVIRPDGERVPSGAHESFLLFAGEFYSMNWAGGAAPAPFSAQPLRPTDAEKVARYNTLIVNAGRFDVSEGVLTIRPEFALVPEYVGGLGNFDYTLSGDTLALEWHTIESVEGTPDPSTAAGVRFHYRWTRR